MHDLINDLAKSVAGEFFFMLDDKMDANDRDQAFEKLRHFSFIGRRDGDGVYRKFKELQRTRRMRTFLPIRVENWGNLSFPKALDELLAQSQFLRVLSLAHRSITKIPQSIGNLKHMRYLNFSHTEITCLPKQVSDLYNLQSFLLSGCKRLSSLAVSFAKLKNLRHLDISYTPALMKMPLGIGGSSSLQTLCKAIIEGPNDDGFKICELKDLSDLEGRLSIEGLHNVTNAGQAKDANLQQKKGLDELVLRWSFDFGDSRNERTEYEVLKELRPHHMLRKLEIKFYGGMAFPSWVESPFDQLTELTLIGCRSCTHLPTLGHLRSLEVLVFSDLERWEKWPTSGGDKDGTATSFPRLRQIIIRDCPKLVEVSVGSMPSLRVLTIDNCSDVVLRSLISVSWSVVTLEVRNIKGHIQLDGEYLKHLGAVEDVKIKDCDEVVYLLESESEACKFLVSLRELEIMRCRNLVSLGKKKEIVSNSMESSIRQVSLGACNKLESYNCPNSVEWLSISDCGSVTSLTFLSPVPSSSLKSLSIYECKNLKSFPHQHLQRLTSLEYLWIRDCPSMDHSFPRGLWPPNLRLLYIGGLKKAMAEWGPQNYPASLVEMGLYGENSGVVSFGVESNSNVNATSTSTSSLFLLPSSLKALEIFYFKEVESLAEVLQHLTCLEQLYIFRCPKLKDLPKSTSSLCFMNKKNREESSAQGLRLKTPTSSS